MRRDPHLLLLPLLLLFGIPDLPLEQLQRVLALHMDVAAGASDNRRAWQREATARALSCCSSSFFFLRSSSRCLTRSAPTFSTRIEMPSARWWYLPGGGRAEGHAEWHLPRAESPLTVDVVQVGDRVLEDTVTDRAVVAGLLRQGRRVADDLLTVSRETSERKRG